MIAKKSNGHDACLFPDTLTHVMPALVAGGHHLVPQADAKYHPTYERTLCGLAAGPSAAAAWAQARRLPLCQACDQEDLRQCPQRSARMLDR